MKTIWLKGEQYRYKGRVWTVTRIPRDTDTEPRQRNVRAVSGGQWMTFHERNIKHKPEYRQAFLAKLALGVVAWPCAVEDTDWPARGYVAPVSNVIEFPQPLEQAA